MYGREVDGVTLTPGVVAGVTTLGDNNLLSKQLKAPTAAAAKPRLARIYAMSFEGTFCNLPKPTLFVVHGTGTPIKVKGFAGGMPGDMDDSALAARDFAWESDVMVWEYDKDDVSVRLDMVTGRLEEILIDATLSAASKYAITSRAEVAARAELVARAEVAGRAELTSRAELTARHRLR